MLGRSRFNSSLYGWAGHASDGDAVSNVSGNTQMVSWCSSRKNIKDSILNFLPDLRMHFY